MAKVTIYANPGEMGQAAYVAECVIKAAHEVGHIGGFHAGDSGPLTFSYRVNKAGITIWSHSVNAAPPPPKGE